MWFRSLLSSLKSRPATAGVRRSSRRPTSRLQFEALEDRFLPSGYLQTNLAADQPGVAQVHDPELVDAWGLSINPNGTFWPSARATDVSTVYSGDVTPAGGTFQPFIKRPLTVTIPGGKPTGQVFNGSSDTFIVSAGGRSAPARFIFASETGHITAWNPTVPTGGVPQSRDAFIMASTPGAVYTGLAIDNLRNGHFIYAADFANARIDVFDHTYAPTTLAGSFTDPAIPADYAPFNIWELGGKLYVTYARQENGDALPDGGHGFVSVFDTSGNFLNRLVSKDHLKEPWGLALAPADFGEFSNTLLVANTANGKINAYDPTTGDFLGRLADASGKAIHIDGLWALHFGNGTVSGDRNALYFTAAPDKHQHGLFGSLRVAPPPAVATAPPSDIGRVDETAALLSALSGEGKGGIHPEITVTRRGGSTLGNDAPSLRSPQPTGDSSVTRGVAAAEDDSAVLDSVFGDSAWDPELHSPLTRSRL
jgi:uncharacterized protein (TIGR03118 family)